MTSWTDSGNNAPHPRRFRLTPRDCTLDHNHDPYVKLRGLRTAARRVGRTYGIPIRRGPLANRTGNIRLCLNTTPTPVASVRGTPVFLNYYYLWILCAATSPRPMWYYITRIGKMFLRTMAYISKRSRHTSGPQPMISLLR